MTLIFVKDHKGRYRLMAAGRETPLPVHFSKTRAIWFKAKQALLSLLPARTLSQEQAFGGLLDLKDDRIAVVHSGLLDEEHLRRRWLFFLMRQRSRHIVLLVCEALVLPLTGLAALLPGPNIAFYLPALLMIVQWQAFRGIGKLRHMTPEFQASPLLAEWETAAAVGSRDAFEPLLGRMAEAFHLAKIRKILWR